MTDMSGKTKEFTCGCESCKRYAVLDMDPDDEVSRTHVCTGNIHFNLINPELSLGSCAEWTPDLETYLELTGYGGPVPYRYRHIRSVE